MSPLWKTRNFATSAHQRLLNLAHAEGIEFNLLLQRYTAERFLYRLSVSQEVDRFVLKGAALLRVWTERELRPTRDIDFLALQSEDRAEIRMAMESICNIACPEDGVVFDPTTIQINNIRGAGHFSGLRARLRGNLGRARLALKIDIGFGDVVTPEPEVRNYPTLLDLPAPRLWTYPRETMVAEKFHAMVSLGESNSRVKDLWDIACLARLFAFGGETLRTAIAETFRRQQTSLGSERPLALLPDYYRDGMRVQHWTKLRNGIDPDIEGPIMLTDAGKEVRRFLGPTCDSLIAGSPFRQEWPAGGPWRSGNEAGTGGDAND